MSFPWERAFASSHSFSRSFHNSINSDIEDYIDSDEEPPRNSHSRKQPAKPKIQKPKKQTPKKTPKTRDEFVEKIEFFSCKICKNTYNSKGSLNRHLTTAHGLEKDVKERKPKVENAVAKSKALNTWAPSRRFRCTFCGKELTSEAFLKRHMAIHDTAKVKVKQTKKVTTNVNINVYNTNHYNYSTPNYMSGNRSIWD